MKQDPVAVVLPPANDNAGTPLYEWSQLSTYSWDDLLLGNGASIAVHDRFAYSSLRALAEKKLGTAASKLFQKLGTDDFERVLLACWHAELVNKVVGTPSLEIAMVSENVRRALIESVRVLHPRSLFLHKNKLELMARFAARFKHVVTFNYDLLLYWALMEWNFRGPQLGRHRFLDGFKKNGAFNERWKKVGDSSGCRDNTFVFYGHGNLALVRDLRGNELKVKAGDDLLLDAIVKKWMTGDFVPIFVSEGDAREKANAIRQSPYLRTVHEQVLPDELGDAIVIYGLGFNANDEHIMKAVRKRAAKKRKRMKFAVSVHPGTSQEDRARFRARVAQNVGDAEVFYFDALSSGAWTYLNQQDRARVQGKS